jgi:hypothetical protein
MVSSGMLRRVALVRADVSEELSASSVRVTRISELGTTLAVTSNRRTLRRSQDKFLNQDHLKLCIGEANYAYEKPIVHRRSQLCIGEATEREISYMLEPVEQEGAYQRTSDFIFL